MGGSGAEPPEGRTIFRKFVEIGNVKFKENWRDFEKYI